MLVKKTLRFTALSAVLCLSLSATHSAAQESKLVDARAAIVRISANDPETKIEAAESAFLEHMKSFSARSAGMDPKVAAAEWLGIVDEAIAIPHRSMTGGLGGAMPQPIGSLNTVMSCLPPPASWPELQALVMKRPASMDRTALQMLCARLLGNDRELLALCADYESQLPKLGQGSFERQTTTATIQVAALQRLGELTKPENLAASYQVLEESFPNLANVTTPGRAQDILLQYINKMSGYGFVIRNEQNVRLARQAVLAHLNELKQPEWSLVEDSGDLPYVLSMVKHFGSSSLEPNGNSSEARIYFRYLLLNGRAKEAARLIDDPNTMPDMSPEDWYPAPKALYQTMIDLMKLCPHKDLMKIYVSVALATDHVQDAIARLSEKIANPSTDYNDRTELLRQRLRIHVRLGDINGLLSDVDEAKKYQPTPDTNFAYEFMTDANALDNIQLLNKGIAYTPTTEGANLSPLYEAYVSRGKLAELEKIQLDSLKAGTNGPNYSAVPRSLCVIYFHANRPKDILELLKSFPYWDENDLSKIDHQSWGTANEDDFEEPIAFYAAWALYKTGQKPEALKIITNVVKRFPEYPLPYSLLNEINDGSTLDIYDDLIRLQPFSPWPLLWKGDFLFRSGKVGQAETLIQQARALDPCATFDYRVKLNSLMAQIRQKQGDVAGARMFTNTAEAAELGKRGYKLAANNMWFDATALLRRAIELAPSDFSLQAQYANYLLADSRPKEAEQHYLLAFQTMPSSLGEASWGDSDLTYTIYKDPELGLRGKAILDGIIKREPKNAETYFARAIVNSALGFSRETLNDLRKTLECNPRHRGAWFILSNPDPGDLMSEADAQNVKFRVIELTQFGLTRMGRLDLSDVGDLAGAYRLLKKKLQETPATEDVSLFPLQCAPDTTQNNRRPTGFYDGLNPKDPAAILVQSQDLMSIASLYHRTRFPFE